MSEEIFEQQRIEEEVEDPFEEERRILLQGVTESLYRILDKFATVNENLSVMEDRNREITKVANVWKDVVTMKSDTRQSLSSPDAVSPLLVQTSTTARMDKDANS